MAVKPKFYVARKPCKPFTSKLKKKIEKLEWKYEMAIERGQKATAARVMRTYENFVKRPVKVTFPGFRPKTLKAGPNIQEGDR